MRETNPLFEQLTDSFEEFWKAYPRKQARKDAMCAFAQTASVRPPQDVLLQALDTAKRSEQWTNPRYIPLAATWLRGERWQDSYETAPKLSESDLSQIWGTECSVSTQRH